MKDKVIVFIIGLLVGAVLATGAFFIYNKVNNSDNCEMMPGPGGNPPSMPNGQNDENGRPPKMPDGNNMPPEMPSEN